MSPYRHAPLVLALLEVRHPQADTLTPGELAALKQKLVRHVPLTRVETVSDVALEFSPAQATSRPVNQRQLHRFLSRDSKTAVSFQPQAMTIETTAYVNWDWFSELVRSVLAARQDVAPVDGVERIGLRYVDEIRIPADVDPAAPPAWEDWIVPELLAPAYASTGIDLRREQQQCAVQYGLARDGQTITLRYGAVNAASPIPRSYSVRNTVDPTTGHFFLIDTDAAWTLPEDQEVPELDVDDLLTVASELHEPSKQLFECSITDRLRQEVLDRD